MKSQRFEIKYFIPREVSYILLNKLKNPYQINQIQSQIIRTLYFDDKHYNSFSDKKNSISNRQQIRIRYYSGPTDSPCFIEMRSRKGRLVEKKRGGVSPNIVKYLIGGHDLHMTPLESNHQLKLLSFLNENKLKPKMIVLYRRISYQPENRPFFRLTIDYCVRAGQRIDQFFNPNYAGIEILNNNSCILEVKYKDYAPFFITDFLQKFRYQRESISKYRLAFNNLKI